MGSSGPELSRRFIAVAAVLAVLPLAAIAISQAAGDRLSADGETAQNRPGRWVRLPSAPLQRTEVVSARVGRAIFAIGGFIPGPETTGAVERYDVDRRRWRRVRSLPIAVNHAGATALGGYVYVMGGYTSATGLQAPTARLYRYNPRTDRWLRLSDAPLARGAHALAATGGRVYAIGGVDSRGQVLTRLDVYDVARRRWSRGPDMRVAREHVGAAALGGRVYALAGRAGGTNFKSAERYDPRTRRWSALPDMNRDRGGNSAAAAGGRIVVFGGEESAGTIREVESWSPRTRRWTRLDDMPTPRHGLGGAGLGDRVYAVEGGPEPGFAFSGALEELQLPR